MIVVLAVLVAALLILPNTAGKPTPSPSTGPHPDGGTTVTVFVVAGTIVFVCFFLAIAWGVVRFFWRISTGDADEGAGSDGYTWRNSREDLEDAMRAGSE